MINNVHSQETDSKNTYLSPKLIIELGGHFNVPVGQARGDLQDFFIFKDYGLVYGIGFHFNVKYAADKKGNLYPYFSAGFCQLQNDDGNIAYIDSNVIRNGYPLPGNLTYSKTNGGSILALRIINLGLGLQYYFSTKHLLLPFAGFEIDCNSIWGFYEQSPVTVLGNEGSHKTTVKIDNTSRIGCGVDIGMDYRISKNLGFVFGTKYKIANLFGKKSDKTQPESVSPGDKNTMNLLDKAATELNSNLNTSRNISYFEFYLGFSVFVGKTGFSPKH